MGFFVIKMPYTFTLLKENFFIKGSQNQKVSSKFLVPKTKPIENK